ncbi:UNVERIFIED_CONTAM: hypothetical protein BEN50_02975 [Euhalothece sp. KZN 001]
MWRIFHEGQGWKSLWCKGYTDSTDQFRSRSSLVARCREATALRASRSLLQTPIVLPPSNLDRAPSFKPRSRTLPPTSIAPPPQTSIAPRNRISYPNHL